MKDKDTVYFVKLVLTRLNDGTWRRIGPSTRNPVAPPLVDRPFGSPTQGMAGSSRRESTNDRWPANFSRKTQQCHQIIERVCDHERREVDRVRKVEQATEVKADAKGTGGITR